VVVGVVDFSTARGWVIFHPGGEVLADAVGRFALGQSCLNLLLKSPLLFSTL
jgi:hypothetical protein